MKQLAALFLISAILISLLLCGCGGKKASSDVQLNERQKEILRQVGASDDPEELTTQQLQSIEDIEEMLSYAEEKYGQTFCYAGYYPASVTDQTDYDELDAYPEGCPEAFFEIIREDGVLSDTYMNTVVRGPTEQWVQDYVSGLAGGAEVIVYADISDTTITDEGFTVEDITGNVEASCMIFVDGAGLTVAQAEALPEAVQSWLEENHVYGLNQLIVLKEGYIDDLTREYYTDYLDEDFCTLREDCDAQPSGD